MVFENCVEYLPLMNTTKLASSPGMRNESIEDRAEVEWSLSKLKFFSSALVIGVKRYSSDLWEGNPSLRKTSNAFFFLASLEENVFAIFSLRSISVATALITLIPFHS